MSKCQSCGCECQPEPAIKDDERRMMMYFLEDKNDVTRWVDWEKFAAAHPSIKRAWEEREKTMRLADDIFVEIIGGERQWT